MPNTVLVKGNRSYHVMSKLIIETWWLLMIGQNGQCFGVRNINVEKFSQVCHEFGHSGRRSQLWMWNDRCFFTVKLNNVIYAYLMARNVVLGYLWGERI